VSTDCNATLEVATFHKSLFKCLKLAWYSTFSKLSDSRDNIIYLSGLRGPRKKSTNTSKGLLQGWLIALDKIPDVGSSGC